jgi:hypothetical protein
MTPSGARLGSAGFSIDATVLIETARTRLPRNGAVPDAVPSAALKRK